MASFFHEYDLRGKYPKEIGEKEAKKVGKAYGTFIEAEKSLAGRDGRKHSSRVTKAFINGILSTGTDVMYAGTVPSPLIYFGVFEMNMEAGAVVTASHNPPEYTGFKFCKENSRAMSRESGMREIERIYETEGFEDAEEQGKLEKINLKKKYIEFVDGKVNPEEDLEVAVNFGNGAASVIGKELLERLGCDVVSVNKDIDGDFPNHLPAPGEKEAQRQLKTVMDDDDLGIIFDGDGDRAGFIVPNYGYVGEDKLMALFSEEILKDNNGTIIHDLRASKLVPEIIEEHGGTPRDMRVGHTFFSEELHRDSSIVFGGELSGHFYFPSLGVPWDDGLFTAALMCQICSEINIKEKLESYPDYPVSPELRIDCPEEAKENVMKRIKDYYADHETEAVDGVKIYFDQGWAVVRPSSTEEKMSVRCEADTEERLDEIQEEVEERVREFISGSQ